MFSNEIMKGVFFWPCLKCETKKKNLSPFEGWNLRILWICNWLIYYTLSFLNKLVTRLKEYLLSFDFHLATG